MNSKSTIINGNLTGSIVGDNNINQSNNTDSFNHRRVPIEPYQKAAMIEVLDEALKQLNDSSKQMALLQSKMQLEQAHNTLPEGQDAQSNKILQNVWTGIKELDSFASSAERAAKYIAPVVSRLLTFLG